MKKSKITPITKQPSLWALSPLLVFLCLYLVVSLIVNDFYKVPITVAFLVSSVYAVCITSGLSLNDRIVLIRELFHNSGDALAAALDAANQANSLAEFVDKMRCDHPDWDEQDPLVYRYYMIVRRKIRN